MKIKKGDHVRFLNSEGGGVVMRLDNKVAWVETEDGFEIPTPLYELVVVASDDTFIPAYRSPLEKEKKSSQKQVDVNQNKVQPTSPSSRQNDNRTEASEPSILHTELAGNDKLSVYLAYLPIDEKLLGSTPYECYLINDSNYCLMYSFASKSNNSFTLLASGFVEPNTKLFVEEFAASELSDRERMQIQMIAFKEQRSYSYKEPISVELKLDTVKFFKLHCFCENDFFDDHAIVYPVIEKDYHENSYKLDPEQIAGALMSKMPDRRAEKSNAKKETISSIVEIDLHAHELLETTAGMSNSEILNYQLDKFHETMATYEQRKGQKIVFIHGKGEGVLRSALEKELRSRYKKHSFQDASFREYGFGATMVVIH